MLYLHYNVIGIDRATTTTRTKSLHHRRRHHHLFCFAPILYCNFSLQECWEHSTRNGHFSRINNNIRFWRQFRVKMWRRPVKICLKCICESRVARTFHCLLLHTVQIRVRVAQFLEKSSLSSSHHHPEENEMSTSREKK